MVDGQKAGLCHYSKSYAMGGVTPVRQRPESEFRPIKEKFTGPAINGKQRCGLNLYGAGWKKPIFI